MDVKALKPDGHYYYRLSIPTDDHANAIVFKPTRYGVLIQLGQLEEEDGAENLYVWERSTPYFNEECLMYIAMFFEQAHQMPCCGHWYWGPFQKESECFYCERTEPVEWEPPYNG